MILAVDELISSLTQNITVPENTNLYIERIRPHIYIAQPSGLLNGSLTLEIRDNLDTVTYASKVLTLSDIRTEGSANLSTNYYHGFISFIFDKTEVLNAGSYLLKLTGGGGYTYNATNFIGWVKEVSDYKYNWNNTAGTIDDWPLDFETFSYQVR